jgi:hypothetical protein
VQGYRTSSTRWHSFSDALSYSCASYIIVPLPLSLPNFHTIVNEQKDLLILPWQRYWTGLIRTNVSRYVAPIYPHITLLAAQPEDVPAGAVSVNQIAGRQFVAGALPLGYGSDGMLVLVLMDGEGSGWHRRC